MHCALTSDSLSLLQRESIIYKKGDSEAGYIETRNLSQDADGKEVLVIKGKFLTGYLNRRIVWGTEILNTTVEVAMRTMLTNNCITAIDTDRDIPNLSLGTLNNYIDSVDYQTSYKNLADEIESLSNTNNLGYRVKFDTTNKKLVFETYEGLNRSVNQSDNARCIFSKEFENILEQEYTDSLNNYKNLCLIGGMGEGVARKLVTIGDSNGLDRFEVFNDQKSLSNETDGVVMNDIDYNNLLVEKGNGTLATTLNTLTFDSKINKNSNLGYKTNWDLGDIVTVVNKPWNITKDVRISEIEEVYEQDGLSINVTFGSSIPTLITKIKQMIN